jgi:stage V sporulation protein AC
MKIEDKEKLFETYNEYVEQVTPKASLPMRMGKAFLVGGVICVIGQAILNIGMANGLDEETAAGYCSMLLVLLSVILTGIGIYPVIASFGGAGALVPITGFANSVAATAHGFKVEGQVFGIGARIFQIAGPVILYGVFSSWVLGLGYWILKMLGLM